MRDLLLDSLLAPLVATGSTPPEDVAAAVLSQLPPEERERILRDMILDRARRTMAARRAVRELPPPRPVAVPDPEPEVLDPVSPAASRPVPVIRPAPGPSAKVTGIRDWWADLLREEVQVSGITKALADCTATDMDVVARQRMGQAQRMARNAKGMAALAEQMRRTRVRTVKDLPRTTAQAALAS